MVEQNIIKMILGRNLVAALEKEISRYKEKADNDKAWETVDGEYHYAYRWIPEVDRSRQIEIQIAGDFPVVLLPDEQVCCGTSEIIGYLHDHLMGDPDRWRIETGRGETTDLILWLDFSVKSEYGDGSYTNLMRKKSEAIVLEYGWEQTENRREIDWKNEKNYLA